MKKVWKRLLTVVVVVAIVATSVFITGRQDSDAVAVTAKNVKAAASVERAPKYVFLFIGDGMSYPQIQAASYYLGAVSQSSGTTILKGGKDLSFMEFPVSGSATTFDSSSFCPDSSSSATSIATGHKTYSAVVNMDETKTISYETISEKLKKQLGYKIGIISSVNINHATPAAFYAHQVSRNNYYGIGKEMVTSGFDYFAGGALKEPTGAKKDQTSIYDLAKEAGYHVITTEKVAEALTQKDGKSIIIGETLADSDSLSYEKDRKDSEWALADYVKKGIEVLTNDTGFFMMVEGGKIDWAGHANDAGSSISDTVALSDAVKEAVAFYDKHPQETLILVTGDHETGGLTIGYAGTNYDTYLKNLQNQKISYAKFDADYVAGYKKNNTPFSEVLVDIKNNFGLMTSEDKDAAQNEKLVLTDYELSLLKNAYTKTMLSTGEQLTQGEYILYSSYEPLTVTITHLLNNKSGISFSSYSHTGLPVGVFAKGVGQDMFVGYYDNTDIYNNLAGLLNVK
ncbi:alkaline phosphatase [Desulfosporosinus fructosivorans]|uniref:Alkaline phosphatase n=1 Tax=Desulfosporosinus fructosivorans TaxID=2018669 RepID=A0A4Z0R061_9FIRM|nr:alkaline phosphatase [Desulfosporosinus fructosivorans]TGE35715.1 alkaline phosphatase [Desulfosporosinus fructosivorans]